MKEFHLEQPRLWTKTVSMWQRMFVNEVPFNEEKSILTAHLLMKPSLVSAVRAFLEQGLEDSSVSPERIKEKASHKRCLWSLCSWSLDELAFDNELLGNWGD